MASRFHGKYVFTDLKKKKKSPGQLNPMSYKDFWHYLYKLKWTKSMTYWQLLYKCLLRWRKKLHSTEHLSIHQHDRTWRESEGQEDNEKHCTLPLPYPLKNLLCSSTSLSLLQPGFSKIFSPPPTHSLIQISLQRSCLPSTPSPWLKKYKCTELTSFSTGHYIFLAPNKLGMIRFKPMTEEQASPKGKKSL